MRLTATLIAVLTLLIAACGIEPDDSAPNDNVSNPVGSAPTVVIDSSTADPPAAVETEELRSFYLEAVIAVGEEDTESGMPGMSSEPRMTTFKWWYRAPDQWRLDIETVEPVIEAGKTVQVSNGETTWYFDDKTGTYTEDEAQPLPPGWYGAPMASFIVGPLPGGDLDSWVAMISEHNPDFGVEKTGEDEILGRPVEVYEFGPVHSSMDEEGNLSGTGTSRIWLDPERQFVLQYEVYGSDVMEPILVEVTDLEYNSALPDETFTFTPPDGARNVSRPSDGPVTIGSSSILPQGFLKVGYVPDGFHANGNSISSGMGGIDSVELRLQRGFSDSDDFITTRQVINKRGLPPGQPGEALGADEKTVYHLEDGEVERLVWSEGDIVVELSSNAVPLEELLKIAASMTPAGEGVQVGDLIPQQPLSTPTATATASVPDGGWPMPHPTVTPSPDQTPVTLDPTEFPADWADWPTPTPTPHPAPTASGSHTPEEIRAEFESWPEEYKLAVSDEVLIRFAVPDSVAEWVGPVFINHVPSGSYAVINYDGTIIIYSYYSEEGRIAIQSVLSDESQMAEIQSREVVP